MAMNYPIKTGGGGVVLSTANGTYETDMMSGDHSFASVYIEFFSDAQGKVAVTPTAGTVVVQGSPMGNAWLDPGENGTITASTVLHTGTATYSPPFFHGLMSKGRVTFAGITGAPYARVIFWRD